MELVYFLIAIIAGSLIPIQTSSNTVLSKSVGGVIPATVIVSIVATACITLVFFFTKSSFPSLNQIGSTPFYAYFGGFIATTYIMSLVFLAPKLGLGNVTVLVVSGQVISIMIIEHFGLFGFQEKPVNFYRVLGVVCLVIGVWLVRKF